MTVVRCREGEEDERRGFAVENQLLAGVEAESAQLDDPRRGDVDEGDVMTGGEEALARGLPDDSRSDHEDPRLPHGSGSGHAFSPPSGGAGSNAPRRCSNRRALGLRCGGGDDFGTYRNRHARRIWRKDDFSLEREKNGAHQMTEERRRIL